MSARAHRLDVFRRGRQWLCVARADGHGSLGTVYEGEPESGDTEALGRQALGWLEAAGRLEVPAEPLRFPEDLLPEGWRAGHWYDFMRTAQLCVLESLPEGRLRLRPYKNLDPVGEEFSHEGGHALDCSTEPRALGAGLLAALDVAGAISKVVRSPHLGVTPHHLPQATLDHLARLGGRLYQRTPHSEVVEVAEGFFLLPPALRQLVFDVIWRGGSRLRDPAGTEWQVRWFPITTLTAYRAWPLMCLARVEGTEIVLRLDTPQPSDPDLYQLDATRQPEEVLGPADGEPAPGVKLSSWLHELEPV